MATIGKPGGHASDEPPSSSDGKVDWRDFRKSVFTTHLIAQARRPKFCLTVLADDDWKSSLEPMTVAQKRNYLDARVVKVAHGSPALFSGRPQGSESQLLNILGHGIVAFASQEKGGRGPWSMLMRTIAPESLIQGDEDDPFPACDFYYVVCLRGMETLVLDQILPGYFTDDERRARSTKKAMFGMTMALALGGVIAWLINAAPW